MVASAALAQEKREWPGRCDHETTKKLNVSMFIVFYLRPKDTFKDLYARTLSAHLIPSAPNLKRTLCTEWRCSTIRPYPTNWQA